MMSDLSLEDLLTDENLAAIELFKACRENVADGSLYHHSKTAFRCLAELDPKAFEAIIKLLRLAHEAYHHEHESLENEGAGS